LALPIRCASRTHIGVALLILLGVILLGMIVLAGILGR
jgi:hypothetical protein